MLPDGLKSLSLRGSSADPSNLKYLPTSITSLNLANTLVVRTSPPLISHECER
jgi:hypothetical protein